MSGPDEREWRAGLKAGDEVMISVGGARGRLVVAQVERATKLHVVIDGAKFRRSTGGQVGDHGWRVQRLLRPDPERLAAQLAAQAEQVERDRLGLRIRGRLAVLPLDTLRAMWALADDTEAAR